MRLPLLPETSLPLPAPVLRLLEVLDDGKVRELAEEILLLKDFACLSASEIHPPTPTRTNPAIIPTALATNCDVAKAGLNHLGAAANATATNLFFTNEDRRTLGR